MERYELNGRFFWFDPKQAPKGAKKVKTEKQVEKENKKRETKNK